MKSDFISLWIFKNIINKCWQRRKGAKGMRVRFFLGGNEYVVRRIGQFSVIPDVTIELEMVKPKRI